ncbi:hypothetical protein LK10_17830 [Sinomonas humi]|uniref:NERD domain-containing protein n=2 Tax=Sinomonas humi TaxID=1338436 RepID=A0A0B2ACR0_9MICC|nr:hypothetical protein LK10_17830 [Sinomonas humi]
MVTVALMAVDVLAVAAGNVCIYSLAVLTHTSLTAWSLLTLLVFLTGLVAFIRIPIRGSHRVRANYTAAAKAARDARVFGIPGGVRSAAARFGAGKVEAGAQGEESTAALLELLLGIPGTAVFHGLQFPGSPDADVDHAVSHGNTVFLLDSKLLRWGTYEWRSMGDRDLIVRSDGYGAPRSNAMHVAAAGYRYLLGPDVEVIPVVMIHGRNTSVGPFSISKHGVHMATAEQAMERIGDTFAFALEFWQDNPSVRAALASKLKTFGGAEQSPT